MGVTRAQAEEIARRFLSVFGFSPTASEATLIDWNVVLNANLMTTGESPKNFARRLLIMTARHLLNDPNIIVFPADWNGHIDGLANGTEPISDFIDFLVTEI